jgi:hypothetical protein
MISNDKDATRRLQHSYLPAYVSDNNVSGVVYTICRILAQLAQKRCLNHQSAREKYSIKDANPPILNYTISPGKRMKRHQFTSLGRI